MLSSLVGITRKFLSKIHNTTNLPGSDYHWRIMLVGSQTSDFLFQSDSSVKLLQSSIAHIDPATQTFATALGQILNNFSAPQDTPHHAISCLRAALQILVTYSISSGDCSWLDKSEIQHVEEASQALVTLAASPTPVPRPTSEQEPGSIEKCHSHALVHQ